MAETATKTRKRRGRAKPIPFLHLSPERQKEYYELSTGAAPPENEALVGALTGFHDTGGYAFGRYPTCLEHPDWRQFSDPDRHTFRTYNEFLTDQGAVVTRGIETVLRSGYLERVEPGWHDALRYLAALRYHEAGSLKLWELVQYLTAAETISYCAVEESATRLFSVHAINRYAIDLAEVLAGWNDDEARALWEDDPIFTGAREYVEQELVIRDWAEGIIADAVVAPTLYYGPMVRFFAVTAAAHGDPTTPMLMGPLTALAERRLRWGTAFTSMALEVEANREVVAGWIRTWQERAEKALRSFAGFYDAVPRKVLEADEETERARAAFATVLAEIGMTELTGAK